ncbi:helix-turn-helix domain-containing protein, partial [Rhodanobacter thiooxydans]|uniref:helix-turn-helix domain-containing protein n=1 Tax=Rhodanobacter thiooxydans TaxID=416169 RepID=UPI000B16D1A1
QWLKKAGFPLRQIAREIGRADSTISREMRRNARPQGDHESRSAHRLSVHRRHAASSLPRISEATWQQVEDRLREDWSPDQIAGH